MLKQANLSFSVAARAYGNDESSIQFSTQDKKTAKLFFVVKEGKYPLNLTDIDGDVTLVMQDKSRFTGEAQITKPLNGVLEYTITPEQIRHAGKAQGELTLKANDGSSVGGFRFKFTIKKALVDEDLGPVKEYYINDLEAVKQEVRGKADAINVDIDNFKQNVDQRTSVIEETIAQLEEGVTESVVVQVEEAKKDTAGQIHTNLDSRIKADVGRVLTEQERVVEVRVGRLDSFKSPGETIVEKSMNEFAGRGINPEWFGVSEENDDNYTAVRATIEHVANVLNGKGKIVFPAGKVIKLKSPLNTFNLSNIFIDLNGCTLDMSGVQTSNTGSAIQFSGTQETGVGLTNNATENTRQLNCATAGFKAGDMVKVYSNKVWDSTQTSTRIGEIAFVESVDSSAQMILTTPLCDSYNVADNASVAKINYISNVVIVNGTIIGASGNNEMRGIRFTRAMNCVVDNIRTIGFDVNHCQFMDCVNCVANKLFIEEANHTAMAYGVSFADACRDCICSNSTFTNVRHSLSTNNNVSISHGITRRILFIGNVVTDSSPALSGTGGDAVDTHAGAEDILIFNNDIFSSSGLGINVEANRAMIIGNRINSTGSVGIRFSPYCDLKPSSVTIANNQITEVGDSVGTDYGILVNLRTSDCANVIIADNEISSKNAAIRVSGTTDGKLIRKGSILGNNCEVKTSGYGIQLDYAESVSIIGGSITAPNFGVGLTDVANSTVSGVPVKLVGTSNAGYGIRISGNSKYNAITGNAVKNAGAINTSSTGVKVDDTATYNGVFGNVTQGLAAGAVSIGSGAGNVQANNI